MNCSVCNDSNAKIGPDGSAYCFECSGPEVFPDLYWFEKERPAEILGLHGDEMSGSWVNLYKEDGTWVASVARCFDNAGTAKQVQEDAQKGDVTILADFGAKVKAAADERDKAYKVEAERREKEALERAQKHTASLPGSSFGKEEAKATDLPGAKALWVSTQPVKSGDLSKAKTVSWLMAALHDILAKHGDVQVDLITEFGTQVEQPLSDVAFSPKEKRVKLLPEGF